MPDVDLSHWTSTQFEVPSDCCMLYLCRRAFRGVVSVDSSVSCPYVLGLSSSIFVCGFMCCRLCDISASRVQA